MTQKTGALVLSIWILSVAATATTLEEQAEAFRRECASKSELAGQLNTIAVPGDMGWYFLSSELRHIGAGRFWGEAAREVSQSTNKDFADPLPVILDFHERLAKEGIELILAPVPPKAFIYPDMLSPRVFPDGDTGLPPRLDVFHQEFYALLREKGVDVLDLFPVLAENRLDLQPWPDVRDAAAYCRQDSHWSQAGCALTARAIFEQVRERPWAKGLEESRRFMGVVAPQPVEITGDLWNALSEDLRPPREAIPLYTSDLEVVDRDSPILLLGDSHTLVFHSGGDMHHAGAGLVTELAQVFGRPIDLMGVRGSGATPARLNLYRRARATEGYLEGKRLVIWVFSAREFTEASSGWRLVPLR